MMTHQQAATGHTQSKVSVKSKERNNCTELKA